MANLDELRKEFTKLTGKQPFSGWGIDQITKVIGNKKKAIAEAGKSTEPSKEITEPVEGDDFASLPEDQRIAIAKKMNERTFNVLPEELIPVFVQGEPFCIIDDVYVPYQEAEAIFLERKIEADQAKLKILKTNLKK